MLRTAVGMVVEQKERLFWNQGTKWNILKPCRSLRNQIFSIRITLSSCPTTSAAGRGGLRSSTKLFTMYYLWLWWMWFSISLPVPGIQKAFPAHPWWEFMNGAFLTVTALTLHEECLERSKNSKVKVGFRIFNQVCRFLETQFQRHKPGPFQSSSKIVDLPNLYNRSQY